MIYGLIVLGCFHLVCLACIVIALFRVPEGYEDEEGFHHGPEPKRGSSKQEPEP